METLNDMEKSYDRMLSYHRKENDRKAGRSGERLVRIEKLTVRRM